MSANPPSTDRLAALSDRYGFGLRAEELDEYAALIEGSLASWAAVDALPEPKRPLGRPRSESHRPDDEENPYNAWYVRTSITGKAGGLLDGKRVAIKDNVEVAGVPMMNGSRILEGYVPEEDATVITRLLDAGAEIVGKSVCEDLCFSGGSHTSATGPVRNPWDPTRTPGGSSSGNGALLAAGEVDLALGGDQGGSVRMPAAFCGVVGLKATWGVIPYTGAVPIEATIDHLGPMARTVRDVATMLQVLAGHDPDDPRQDASITVPDCLKRIDDGVDGLRVAIVTEGFGWPDVSEVGVDEVVADAAWRFAEIGAHVTEVSIPAHRDAIHIWNVIATEGATTQLIDLHGSGMNWKGRYSPQLVEALRAGRRDRGAELSPTVKITALTGAAMIEDHGGAYYAKARNLVPSITAAYDKALTEADVLVLPTLPMVAPPIPAADAPLAEQIARAFEMIPNTAAFDVTGHPAISVPAGLVDGLPAGLMIVGRMYDEATVVRAAQAFEQLVGGFRSPVASEVAG